MTWFNYVRMLKLLNKIQIRIPQAQATYLSQEASCSVREGLLAATNELWSRLTPCTRALREKLAKASQISGTLTELNHLQIELLKEPPKQEPPKPAEKEKPKMNVIWR